MQSFFRLPWSTDTAGDKALLDTVVLQKARPQKPIVDLPAATNTTTTKAKRKRISSFESSPKSAPQPKKLKTAPDGGAVQPLRQPARGSDIYPVFAPHRPTGHVKSEKSAENTGKSIRAGDNTPGRLAPASADRQLPSAKCSGSDQPLKEQQLDSAPTVSAPSVTNTKLSTDIPVMPIDNKPDEISAEAQADYARAIIGAHFDLEIMLRHNELRLIEHELAKCQVALEQLRRCELIPYPGSQGISLQLAAGVGPSLKSRPGFTTPAQPAPYGVTDGPYTQHYKKWLISDPLFDPQHVQAAGSQASAPPLHDRATRRSGGDGLMHHVGSARASRVFGVGRPELGREQPQPWRDPLILKRQSDGQWVKLICTKCNPERSNFQNVQGFLNHCRISHKDSYESHEAAAVACGRPVEVDETYLSAPTPTQQPRKPAVASFADPSPSKTATATPAPALVFEKPVINNLIRTAPVNPDLATRRNSIIPRAAVQRKAETEAVTSPLESPTPLVMAQQTPYLSALMHKKHMSGDLAAAVAFSKRKVDTSLYDATDSEAEQTSGSKNRKQKKVGHTKQPNPPAPTQKAGLSTQSHHPKHPTVAGQHLLTSGPIRRPNMTLPSLPRPVVGLRRSEIPDSPNELNDGDDMDLSPGTAADSNPGLVSDREDDDDDADEDAMVVDPTVPVHQHHHQHHHRAPPTGLGPGLGVPGNPNRSCRGSLVEIDGFAVEIEDSDGEGGREGAKRVRVGGGGNC